MMLNGKTVVLSGAAGGIGEAVTRRLLDEGARVAAVDIDPARLAALRERMGAPSALSLHTGDVGSEADCKALAESLRQTHGAVDILINNAGYFPLLPFAEMTYADWKEVLRINLDSVFLMSKALLPLIQGRGWGRLINIGSGSMFRGVASQVHYVSAKAGVLGFTRSMARLLGPEGITVNLVAPGLTSTATVLNTMPKEAIEASARLRAIGREQRSGDLTGAVLFLCSTQSDFITGQTLNVDGGSHML